MDTLPKNNSDDFSAFTGVYPDNASKQKPVEAFSTQGSVSSGSTLITEPLTNPELTSQQQETVQPTTPTETTSPFMIVSEVMPKSAESKTETISSDTTQTISPETGTTDFVSNTMTEPTPESIPPPAPPAIGARKFNFNSKRMILLILFISLFLGLGYGAFQVIGRILTANKTTTLTYWGLWEDETFFQTVVSEYKKTHPKVDIVYTKQNPKQYRERLQASIARGNGPDLFRFHNSWIPMLKSDLAGSTKNGYSVVEFRQTFYPVAQEDLILSGKVVGAPLMIDGLGLYYNENLLKAAGITPPATWEEFQKAAATLTIKNSSDQIITAGAALGTAGNVEHFSDILALMMMQNGTDLKKPDSQDGVDTLTFYRMFAEKPNNVWDETLDNSILAFANGKVAFIFAPSWQTFTIKELNPQLKFQILSVPQLPGTNVTWASYWVEGVSSKSKYTDESWEFLKFLSSKETMVKLYTEMSKTRAFGEPYSRVDLAQTLINAPLVGVYIKQAPNAKSFFLSSRTHDNGINQRMIKYLEDAVNSLSKGVSTEAALETVAKGFTQVLSSFGSAR